MRSVQSVESFSVSDVCPHSTTTGGLFRESGKQRCRESAAHLSRYDNESQSLVARNCTKVFCGFLLPETKLGTHCQLGMGTEPPGLHH